MSRHASEAGCGSNWCKYTTGTLTYTGGISARQKNTRAPASCTAWANWTRFLFQGKLFTYLQFSMSNSRKSLSKRWDEKYPIRKKETLLSSWPIQGWQYRHMGREGTEQSACLISVSYATGYRWKVSKWYLPASPTCPSSVDVHTDDVKLDAKLQVHPFWFQEKNLTLLIYHI